MVNPPEKEAEFRIWQRSYPTGERIDLYGYPMVLQPINPGDPAVSFLGNWPVAGEQAAAFAAQASPYDFLHAWGQLHPDGQGRLTFRIEGWETSPYEDLLLNGQIERQGEQAYLATDQGRYQLLEAPAELEDGMSANARGVSRDGATFDWSYIDNNQYPDGGYGMLDACAVAVAVAAKGLWGVATLWDSAAGQQPASRAHTYNVHPPQPVPTGPDCRGRCSVIPGLPAYLHRWDPGIGGFPAQ